MEMGILRVQGHHPFYNSFRIHSADVAGLFPSHKLGRGSRSPPKVAHKVRQDDRVYRPGVFYHVRSVHNCRGPVPAGPLLSGERGSDDQVRPDVPVLYQQYCRCGRVHVSGR